MKKSRSTTKGGSAIKEIALGSLVIWCAFFLVSLVFSLILFFGEDPTKGAPLFSILAFILAGGIGTLINKKALCSSSVNSPLFSAALTAILYLIVSGIVSAKICVGAIVNAVCFIFIALLLSFKRRKTKKRRTRA